MVCHADVLEVPPQGHDPVVEGDAGCAAAQLPHLECRRCFVGDVQALAVAVRSQKDAVCEIGVDGLCELGFEANDCSAVRQLL